MVAAWLVFLVAVPVRAWNDIARVDNAPAQRVAASSGRNYLLVGTDARDDLTEAERAELSTGFEPGSRTDSILLVHVSNSGKSSIISIPRDSYVPIPDNGSNKINAAYAFGGPKLLTETVEQVTGLRIDGYVELGFGGFARLVDSLGGVDICVPFDMDDPMAGIDLAAGCQTLDGANALGYVRSRYADPRGDLGRAERQRQFLGAVMSKAATPSTVLLPWRYTSFVDAAASGVRVGEETSLFDAVALLQTLRAAGGEDVLSMQVPVATAAYQTRNAGIAVKWDTERAKALFDLLREDEPLTEAPSGTTA